MNDLQRGYFVGIISLSFLFFLILLLYHFIYTPMFIYKPKPEELIPCKVEEIYIDYKCSDGRWGIVTLKEWVKIKFPYDRCVGKYYYKCEGINPLIPSERIK